MVLKLVNLSDIHKMVYSDDLEDQIEAAIQLRNNFVYLPDKIWAWEELRHLIHTEDSDVRWNAAKALGYVLPHIYDKKQAWDDLHRLTNDNNEFVRWKATEALGSAFPDIPDKKLAVEDLHRLMKDKTSYVRLSAEKSLVSAVLYIQDDAQAWEYLHWLIRDEDIFVRTSIVKGLSHAFPYIINKISAWDYLLLLLKDEDAGLRAFVNYSLGRASIFKAGIAENEEKFKEELEKAFEFFEKSLTESNCDNPADFCLPFYRLFYTLTFEKQKVGTEVQEYFREARRASEGSESKEKLLEAIGFLANALKEVQKTRESDLNAMKRNINIYRQYCERAIELLDRVEQEFPGATRVLRRGLPLINKKMKGLLEEIEEKTKEFCKNAQLTPFDEISRNAYRSVKGLGEVRLQIDAENRLNELSPLLQSMCRILPEESENLICKQLKKMDKANFPEKVRIIESALSSIQPQIISLQEKLVDRENLIEYFKDLVIKRLDNIDYSVFKLKLHYGNFVPVLDNIQNELKKLETINTDLNLFGLKVIEFENFQHHNLQRINNDITKICEQIENKVIPRLPQTSDTQMIMEKLHDLKQSEKEIWFNRVAGLSSIIGLLITIL